MNTRLLALLTVLALLIVACGGETTDDEGTTDGTEEATDEEASDEANEDAGDEAAEAGDCEVDSLPLFADGTLTIATGEPVFPPWMIDDDPTNGEGFESAVAYALAEEMGFSADQVEWVRTEFDAAITPGDKDYDFNMQQYSITEERDEVVDFSVPYYESQKSVIALNGTPAAEATSFEELQAGTWGATVGTTDLDYMENVLELEDVAVFDTQADVVAAMVAGQIDATVAALPTALFLTAVEIEDATIAAVLPAEEGTEGEGMGLLFSEGSELKPCVDAALTSLDEAGTLDELAVEWLQGDGDIPLIES
ncbi:ABC transporter substrate-binding protein [Euzebya tangerina]|uniref:ABC transporter substrate-binding protein n=1 Tax=Euzebya tangerina TaxID=591198 RepID=UPI000E30DEFC|nr:ABC transporter substrate-binding protein [Euzebya tangerina]